jgi:hypothetical protein
MGRWFMYVNECTITNKEKQIIKNEWCFFKINLNTIPEKKKRKNKREREGNKEGGKE